MSLLAEVLSAVEEVQADAELNALRFRLSATWSDGAACRYSVKDPNKGQDRPTRLQTDPIPASLRLLRLWPGDPEPDVGASVSYQGGTLVLGLWSDESAYTGQRVGVCRLVDARAYPTPAALADGSLLRLRIVALDAPAMTAEGLSATTNNSHRAHLPPGVQLQPGDTLSTSTGDQYRVVPPVQRDALGDTLGLSWQGQELTPALPGVTDPDPTTPPTETGPPGHSGWWDEGLPP